MRISTKLILFLVCAVVAVMAVYALVTISRTQEQMSVETEKMVEHLGMALSVGVLHHLEEGDTAGVAEVLETMARYPDVVGAAVYDARGGPVAVSGPGFAAGGPSAAAVAHDHATGRTVHERRMAILNARGEEVGSLRLAVTGHSLVPYVIEARNHILLTILILTGVISGLIIYFSRRHLAGPLARLTAGAEAIGRGELGRRIDVDAGGEVGQLAVAFNRMAANLEATTRQIVAEREYIRSVVDSLAEGIVVLDRQCRITAWNRTMARRHGKDLEQVIGQPLDQALPGIGAQALSEVLDGRRATAERARVVLPEDPARVLAVSASALRLQGGQIEGAVLVLADITQRLALEDQVQRSERLAAVGQMAAGLAHEIGTPLNVISGTAEYLRMDRADKGEGAEELQTIVTEVRRIADLVQKLMAFARHEAPRVEAVAVGEGVDSVLALLRHQMERRGIQLAVEVEPDLPPLAADRAQIQQVLVNLVMNAWQAMPEGGTLSLRARLGRGDGGRLAHPSGRGPCPSVVVEVADTGTGIRAQDLPRIFDPFFTTKDVGQGTGLGLAIVQRIVDDHGGRVEVASQPGRGTTFTLTLPACSAEVGAAGAVDG